MSLIDAFMNECCKVTLQQTSDGAGGKQTVYVDGTSFRAAITLDTSAEFQAGNKTDLKQIYTVTVDKSISLQHNALIKRKSDGRIFRITSDGSDKATPDVSSLNLRQATAERVEV